ncbi:unnamed protein product [Cyprideis torosa]|uniref:Uncharacterized protein n=1 Tax=Cyprideis torosa TaxID=163714 RepID=A0A7R8ZVJ4_9CRUS|nr:unnamed protein product [Cyprideis torosa]CAG0907628.1 unnamed protein product [Cyprideis torosa]
MDDCETGSFYSMLSTTYEQGDCTIKSIRVNATITGFHHSDLGLYLVRGNNIVTLLHLVGGTCPVVRGEYSFSDLATASPTTAAICEGSPFEFRPQIGLLSDFAGLPVSGNWAVFLQDTSACDPVGLHDLKIIVNEEHVVRLDPKELRPVMEKV